MPLTPGVPMPDVAEMVTDLRDAYADPDWTASDEMIRALWCEMYEVPADHPEFVGFLPSEPGAPGNDGPDERHDYEA